MNRQDSLKSTSSDELPTKKPNNKNELFISVKQGENHKIQTQIEKLGLHRVLSLQGVQQKVKIKILRPAHFPIMLDDEFLSKINKMVRPKNV